MSPFGVHSSYKRALLLWMSFASKWLRVLLRFRVGRDGVGVSSKCPSFSDSSCSSTRLVIVIPHFSFWGSVLLLLYSSIFISFPEFNFWGAGLLWWRYTGYILLSRIISLGILRFKLWSSRVFLIFSVISGIDLFLILLILRKRPLGHFETCFLMVYGWGWNASFLSGVT